MRCFMNMFIVSKQDIVASSLPQIHVRHRQACPKYAVNSALNLRNKIHENR